MSGNDLLKISTNVHIAIEKLDRFPDVVIQELIPAVAESQQRLQQAIQERTPSSGAPDSLKGSIGAEPVKLGISSIEGFVGTVKHYAVPVELGTRPYHPPIVPLMDWVKRRLGKVGKEGKSAAFAIAQKIAKEGKVGSHMFSEGLAEARDEIHETIHASVERAIRKTSD